MKIALVDPKGVSSGLNSGLAYLIPQIKKVKKVTLVKLFDFNNSNPSIDKIKDFDIVGISIKSFTQDSGLEIIKKIKEKNKLLIAGGPHLMIDGYDFMSKNKEVDVGIVGEAEETIIDLINNIGNLKKVKGIYYRDNNKVVKTETRPFTQDLDKLEFPDFSYFNTKIKVYPLVTSRGCPFNCSYCSVNLISGRKWRSRSVASIIKELKHAIKEYKIKEFEIIDDDFTLDMDRAKEFCKALIKEKLNLKWGCPNGIRADRVDYELLTLMKQSGCTAVSYGIESGDSFVFQKINKGESLDVIKNAITMSKKIGLYVQGKFIIGLPYSNKKTFKNSLKFALSLPLDEANWNMLVPYPGTQVYDWVLKNGKFLKPWQFGFHTGDIPEPIFETKEHTKKEMINEAIKANIACHNFGIYYKRDKSKLYNIFNLLYLIFRYDPERFHKHIVNLTKKFYKKQKLTYIYPA